MNKSQGWLFSGLLMALLVLVYCLFMGGLVSDFYLDDLSNLTVLQHVSAPGGFWYATLQNASSALGRPLAMLSFALQAEHWPENPAAFKQINLLIHLANSALVALLSLHLFRLKGLKHAHWLALAVALYWSIAPLHLSSVLYTIQRMTLLATCFSLLGVLAYFRARRQFAQCRWRRGYLELSLSYGACLLLGVLAKENAVLLPLLILLIDNTLYHNDKRPPYWNAYKRLAFWLPLILLAIYLLFFSASINYDYRPFSLTERLLTQSRVLFHYLAQFFWPIGPELSIYHDDFVISKSWLIPLNTLPSVLGWLTLIGLAWANVRRWPAFSFVVGWYLLAQLLESSIIPLEIYFEHRSYLPLVAIAWGSVLLINRLLQKHLRYRWLIAITCTLYLLAITAVTLQQARLWSQPLSMAAEKLERHPESERARLSAAQQLLNRGEHQAAAKLLMQEQAFQQLPAIRQGRLLLLGCSETLALPTPEYWRQVDYSRDIIDSLQRLVSVINSTECRHWNLEEATALVENLQQNPAYTGQARLHLLTAQLALHQGNTVRAKDEAQAATERGSIDAFWLLIDIALAERDGHGAAIHLEQVEQRLEGLGWRGWRYQRLFDHYQSRVDTALDD
ncbi:hypothetical protein MIB92_04815 [Aestuariirhabdus sp. Z084]|uniref:hypothetical protein n=1 Tax=Aestuariirhabdus haliotis TaxID=2918751 RepID=UPI00201B36FF|nr:hypothetical protein [Aestuariirhabdus haliotis]MCL6414962.1 hypothetical protein [Aestuariirhabdus haliotis]MCL6418894.1 hypothetical protein [Aestuariirhabdus haliotis]